MRGRGRFCVTKIITHYTYNENLEYVVELNPIRYRGYYYDTETGYYYLQSRYYDPSISRFINSDIPEIAQNSKDDAFGLNLFAYCGNDPVNNVDYEGYKYYPSKAKSYADKWWNSTNKKSYLRYNNDCANFVSQCLFYAGLSKKVTSGNNQWYYKPDKYYPNNSVAHAKYSSSWVKANDLYNWLNKTNHIYNKSSFKTKSGLSSELAKLYQKPACYAAVFFDWNNDGTIDHAALLGKITSSYNARSHKYTYDGYYYAHTSNRAGDDRWYYDKDNKKYYKCPLSKAFDDYKYCRIYICVLQ